MSNFLTATVQIKGTRPLWQHRFGPDALPLEKQERTGVAGNDPIEWRRTCSITSSGQLYFDPTYVFACLRNGAKYVKSGKGSIQPKVSATLQSISDIILIDRWYPGFPDPNQKFDANIVEACSNDFTQPVYIDVRGVVNPSTKGRNVRYRLAASPGWGTEFLIVWDKTIVSRGEMESVVHDSGRLVGLGNGRTIGMGRFDVVSFSVG